MCQNHNQLKVLRTYGIELEGYTPDSIRGNRVNGWSLIHDGSLNDGRESCDYCEGSGNRTYDCDDCCGHGHNECYNCDGYGDIECSDCCGGGEVPCDKCDCTGVIKNDDGEEVECDCCEGSQYVTCSTCDGNGRNDCNRCDGSGDIECDNCSGEGYYSDECNECYGSGYNGDEEEGCGVECVSGILNEGEYESIDTIFDYITRHDWSVNSDCGTHVHVGADDLEATDLSKLYLLQNIIEPFIYGISPDDRFEGTYAKMTKREVADSFMRIGSEIDMQMVADYYYGYSVRLDGSFQKYDGARYYGLNLHSWYYRNRKNGSPTVEFRYFEGCGNRDEAKAWIDLCIKLVDFAKHSTFEQLLVIGRELYLVDNLKEYIAKVKELLGLEYNFVAQSTWAFQESKHNVASVFRDTHVITRAV